MPELIHNFTSGKMNKDLDERLVPNGEYRDSLNLEISTSESSNVGALQTVLGNASKTYKSVDPQTGVVTSWGNGFIPNLVNPTVIGTHRNPIDEKIYFFIASENVSAIAEYNQTTNVVVPVIVDTQSILNFSTSYLITGISILEGLLIWTDNQTEPKLINIEDWRTASTNFLAHTQFNGRAFLEEDITVIKKYPLTAPVLALANTRTVDENGDPAIVQTSTLANFTIPNADPAIIADPMPPGTLITLTWTGQPLPFYRVGDILILTTSAENDDEVENNYEARVQVLSVPPGNTQTFANCSVLSVSEGVQTGNLLWDVVLQEEDPLFEFKFPRFAYRWKYEDGQYSCYSPFSEVAFIPDTFRYNTFQGYNLGMVNQLRQCLINSFVTSDIPVDVIEVDLLYKESNSTAVYSIDTFIKDDEIWTANSFNLESEIITSLVPSNQLLRPYDNVPRVAKALDISANRLIFGNYLQNYTLKNSLNELIKPTIDIVIEPDTSFTEMDGTGIPVPGTPHFSIKSQRTYQIGVVYNDKYGRQTPVFTSESAATTLPKQEANNYNRIQTQITSLPPEGFTHFTYYVKENSQEYYNVAMDRWYEADDQNVWISFPSSERNKIQEDTFLELKKQHDSNDFVEDPARFKVIAISNEAPAFIKEIRRSFGTASNGSNNQLFKVTGFPLEDRTWVEVDKTKFEESTLDAALSSSGNQLRILGGVNRSDWYDVTSISLETSPDRYRIAIAGKFGPDMIFTSTDESYATAIDNLQLEIAKTDSEDRAEFTGRFFVKLYRNPVLEQYVLANPNEDQYSIANAVVTGYLPTSHGKSWWKAYGGNWFIDKSSGANMSAGLGWTGNVNEVFKMDISFGGIWPEGSDFNVGRSVYPQYKGFVDGIEQVGTKFRWKEDPDQLIYEITAASNVSRLRNYEGSKKSGSFNNGSNKRRRWSISAKLVSPAGASGWSPVVGNPGNQTAGYGYTLEILQPFFIENSFTSTIPGIWETEPKEAVDLDLYYKASNLIPIAQHGNASFLPWFNCVSFGNGVESDRIRDDYNAPTIDNGPIISAPLDEPYAEERKPTGFIYSGLFNSISGVNNLNQFIQAESITLDMNPRVGSIQKLWARDTDLISFCEDKVLTIPANKDLLYSAGGNAALTASNRVLGTPKPYAGEFGISKNPESFANYGFRAYFTDKARGAVLRLSSMPGGGGNGITEISSKGMEDFFADNLAATTLAIGGFDDNKRAYNLSLNPLSSEWQTKLVSKRESAPGVWEDYNPTSTVLTFKEMVDGWETRKSFEGIEGMISLNNRFYSFKDGMMWEHGESLTPRLNFYGVQYDSSINFLINDMPQIVKSYKTLNYTGSKSREYLYSNASYTDMSVAEMQALRFIPTSQTQSEKGWYTNYLTTDLQSGQVDQFLEKEGKWFQYLKGDATYFATNANNNLDSHEFSMQGIGRASTITGDLLSAYNVHVFINPSCYESFGPPTANNMTYTLVEDCGSACVALQLSANDPNP